MTDLRIVYAVTSDDYDWWSLDALFERREDAEAAVAAGFGMTVEESRIYPAGSVPERIDYWEAGADITAQGSLKTMDGYGGPGTGSMWVRRSAKWTGSGFTLPELPRVRLSPTTMGGTYISVEAMTEDAAREACETAVVGLLAQAS